MLTLEQEKIIIQLIRQEVLLYRLYTIFDEKLEEHGDLWSHLAREEAKHAKWLKQLALATQRGHILFNQSKITEASLKVFQKLLEQTIVQAEAGEIDEQRALIQAASFERSLIEKNIFTSFTGTSDQAEKTMKRLREETDGHLHQIEAVYAREIMGATEIS